MGSIGVVGVSALEQAASAMKETMAEPGEFDYDLIVVGGGAAGFFAAIACADARPDTRILILEKSREVLGKVRISGGGRCNVTHGCFDPRELVGFYPRGGRQLIGPLHRWGPADTMTWFEDRGVPLKIEDDGRVFPQSDSSQSIIDCLMTSARTAGVELRTSTALGGLRPRNGGGFDLDLVKGGGLSARFLFLALGGTRNRLGADLAGQLGHRIEPAAPSLFTFKIDDPRLEGLQGLSVKDAVVRVDSCRREARGPVLVTHWGLSGPGILKLSAWGARDLQALEYRFEIRINWCGDLGVEEVMGRFHRLRDEAVKRKVANDPQFGIPSRLWKRLVETAELNGEDSPRWPHLTRAAARKLADALVDCRFKVQGKSLNKDEFVTCGGIHLGDVDMRSMESRRLPGLYFGGEILDIDGVTGGFNFQAAWTTAKIAGEAVAESL